MLYTCDVLSHLRDPLSVVRSFNHHLSAGGLLVLETGNFPDVDARYHDRLTFNFPDHLYFFGESATIRLLSMAGFVVTRYSATTSCRRCGSAIASVRAMPRYATHGA